MGTKKLTSILIVLLSLTACASHDKLHEPREEVLFKNFVLAICLETAFKDSKIASDANKAANGYMEFGNMPMEAYLASGNIVDDWLSKNYASKSGGQIEIMKCIDLYRSLDLKILYEKYSPCNTEKGCLNPKDYDRQCD